MNRNDVIKFISDNQNERLLDYYDKCYDKLKDLNTRIDKTSLYIIIITFLYFIASGTTISSIQVGPATISDISILLKIIPVLFAFLLLQIIVISSQKAELFKIVKLIFLANYVQDINPKEFENENNNIFTRILLPFSYSTELLKFSMEKTGVINSCLGVILVLPLLSLIFLPFYFEFYMLKTIWTNYYSDTLGKISFWLTIWITAYMLHYLISNFIINFRDAKNELQ
ncbi:hypothetical protein U3A58_13820 [Algoriphagus sp. C2-6-M1]|uniref:hypothetical protein n=1 Tax=Algoriphagus persicinus TaxID=3108754 RepID=UPI002B3A5191|nr:hypothetical protein [Algoriphagus sp. C2-6-M1]MEB2781474.1 hypothetical protein [Algoriphagus sp. C2-6-M1]